MENSHSHGAARRVVRPSRVLAFGSAQWANLVSQTTTQKGTTSFGSVSATLALLWVFLAPCTVPEKPSPLNVGFLRMFEAIVSDPKSTTTNLDLLLTKT